MIIKFNYKKVSTLKLNDILKFTISILKAIQINYLIDITREFPHFIKQLITKFDTYL